MSGSSSEQPGKLMIFQAGGGYVRAGQVPSGKHVSGELACRTTASGAILGWSDMRPAERLYTPRKVSMPPPASEDGV